MKKQFKLFILCFILLFICCGCNGDVTRDIRHEGFSVGSNFICDAFYPKNKDDVSYDKIKYFTGSHIINKDGVIYELSLDKPYTSKQNCKVAETNLIVKAIFDNKIIKATDGKYYYLVPQNNVNPYTLIPETDNSYTIYDLLLRQDDVVKAVTANSSTGEYYVLKNDGNVYTYTISKADRNSPAVVTSVSIVYNKNDFGAPITDFNYAGDSISTFVRTGEKVFRMRVTNADQCMSYAEVKCNYQMMESEIFNKYGDRIISFNGSVLITDYKLMFNVTS